MHTRKAITSVFSASLAALLLAQPFALTAGGGRVGRTLADSHPPQWPSSPAPAKGAPNVLVILTDDVGYGVSGAFGGPVSTPTFDALAKQGLRFNRFNTAALCSPTRAALLTGRYPHKVNMGNVANLPSGYDGYTTVIPKTAATMAEILKEQGYNTAMFGKNHLTPDWEMSPAGPFDRWPTGMGFEYFYGFMSADTSMWAPSIVENTRPVEPPHNDPTYHFEHDMADKAIAWMRRQNASAPEKPFFMYYATGTAHTPHHAPKDWIERYRGKFDQGWDAVRESTFARQKGLGIIPADSGLSPRPKSLPAWDSLTADQKRLYARMMEVHAGAISYMDAQVGRVIDEVKRSGRFDNTLVIFIEGDNGASAEGGLGGLAFEQSSITGAKESFAYQLSHIDDLGGPNMYNHFPVAWAWAMNSPFPWWKQVASQAGGVRNGMVVSWPARIKDKGALRSQYAFVSDIMPTVLEAAGVKAPAVVNGVPQQPIDGISLAYSFDDPRASSRRRTQIYEMMENFGIYKDGWMAGVEPKRAAWEVGGAADQRTDIGPDQRKWDLYNLETDFTTAKDLSAVYPAKLKAMQDLFWVEARKDNILPLHNWMQGAAGRPSLGRDRLRFEYPPGVTGISEDSAPHTIGRSFRIDAQVDLGRPDTNGVLITQGGRFGGYAFYLKDGRPVFHYNAVGEHQFTVRAAAIVPPGRHELSADFRADAPKPGAGGDLTLSVDGQAVASGRIGRTVMVWMSHTEGLDIGRDTITAISDDYRVEDSGFQGVIENVVVTVKP